MHSDFIAKLQCPWLPGSGHAGSQGFWLISTSRSKNFNCEQPHLVPKDVPYTEHEIYRFSNWYTSDILWLPVQGTHRWTLQSESCSSAATCEGCDLWGDPWQSYCTGWSPSSKSYLKTRWNQFTEKANFAFFLFWCDVENYFETKHPKLYATHHQSSGFPPWHPVQPWASVWLLLSRPHDLMTIFFSLTNTLQSVF